MKGMVFTFFLELVENKFGLDVVDTIIERSGVASGGAYTAVGTYPHSELVDLLLALEQEVAIPIPALLEAYGKFLFDKLIGGFSEITKDCQCSRDLLHDLDGVIHVEVQKLYPDAQLPRFNAVDLADGSLEMHYLSDRHMEDLAEGLLRGAFAHFKETVELTRRPAADGAVIFNIRYLP